jgi:hypothetical protein
VQTSLFDFEPVSLPTSAPVPPAFTPERLERAREPVAFSAKPVAFTLEPEPFTCSACGLPSTRTVLVGGFLRPDLCHSCWERRPR